MVYRLVNAALKVRRKIEEYLERRRHALSPEVRIELERRYLDQHGD